VPVDRDLIEEVTLDTRPQEEKISADEAIGTTSPLKKSLFLLDAMV